MKRVVVLALAGAFYAWWASGVAPFTALAYVLVAVATAAFVVSYAMLGALSAQRSDVSRYYRTRSGDTRFKSWAPWLVALTCAVTLEIVGLALGGRSATVPTVSTMLDHLLIYHWSRGVLYFLWLGVGGWSVVRLARHVRSGDPR